MSSKFQKLAPPLIPAGDAAIDVYTFFIIISAGETHTLPLAADCEDGRNHRVFFKNEDGTVGQASATCVTILPSGSDTIEGEDSLLLANHHSFAELYPDGVDTWFISRSSL